MNNVLVVWCEIPETITAYVGRVTGEQLDQLVMCHNKYINGLDEPEGMCSWFYTEDAGLLTLGRKDGWGLQKRKKHFSVPDGTTVIITGFLL